MDFSGFFKPYPADWPLTDKERARQLAQKKRLPIDESDDLSVIRFNSAYMEIVDKWFAWRGIMTLFSLVGIAAVIASWAISITIMLGKPELLRSGGWLWFGWLTLLSVPFLWLMAWFLRTDAFRFSHYPIRLNRKARMVHVFRTDGTVLTAPWNDIFFCIASLPQNNWEIQGHVLETDGVTVKETFALPAQGTGAADREQLPRYWEFVRRYMEEGPQSVAKHVQYCLPIADRRERFTDGFHRMHGQAHAVPAPFVIAVLLFLYIVPYPGRWLAMKTSKLPVWPQEIEDACVVDPSDTYRKDASMNQPITDHSLIYLVAAIGVGLLIWAWW